MTSKPAKSKPALSAAALSLALLAGLVAPSTMLASQNAFAADEKPKPPSVGPKVAKPLKEAQDLGAAKKFTEALAKVQEAEAVPGKTPYENYVVEEVTAYIYANLQDYPNAAKAIEATLLSGQMDPALVPPRMKSLSGLYYQSKNYPKSIEWAEKYVKETSDPEMQILIGQAYYIQKAFKPAADALRQGIKLADAKSTPVKEDWLQVLMSSEYELGNTSGVQGALESLVQRYPSPKYWEDLLSIMEKSLKGSSKTSLDIYRLMFKTGVMKRPEEYTEMAELALQQGSPGEAKVVMQKGLEAGVLGQGSQKAQHASILARATSQSDSDQKQLAKGAEEAKAKPTGEADVKFGEAFWSYGQYDKAVDAIQRGLKKGVKDKDDGQLRLGLAYLGAGNRAQALEAFSAITPNTPSAQVAKLWTFQSAPHQAAAQ